MNMKIMNQAVRWAALLVAALLISGCAGLGKPSHVNPGSIGRDVDLSILKQNSDKYRMFYSGHLVRPEALLFVPRNSPYQVQLKNWKRISSRDHLQDLIRYIEYREVPYTVRLKAIVPRDRTTEKPDPIAYLYSKHSASLQPGPGENEYHLYGVSHAGNDGFGRDRFRLRRGD